MRFCNLRRTDKHVTRIDETPLMSDQKPIMLYDGDLSLATSDGSLSSITLKSYTNSPNVELKDQLKVLIQLRKNFDAWEVCKLIDSVDSWNDFGMAAVADLNISLGKCVRKSIRLMNDGYSLVTLLFRSSQSIPVHWQCGHGICVEIDWIHWGFELCFRFLCVDAEQNRRSENFLHEKCESTGSVEFVSWFIAMGTGIVVGRNIGTAANTGDSPRICTTIRVHVSENLLHLFRLMFHQIVTSRFAVANTRRLWPTTNAVYRRPTRRNTYDCVSLA